MTDSRPIQPIPDRFQTELNSDTLDLNFFQTDSIPIPIPDRFIRFRFHVQVTDPDSDFANYEDNLKNEVYML